jgi:hypothetical protein
MRTYLLYAIKYAARDFVVLLTAQKEQGSDVRFEIAHRGGLVYGFASESNKPTI